MIEQPSRIVGSVPIPNPLFDEVLPTLTDTELRVLLVIMRATLGWREGNNSGGWSYKRRDWITHTQFVRRTGRSSASVSAAIRSLSASESIRVENAAGTALTTSEERRLNMGRLYFALGDKWKSVRISDIEKLSTTTNNMDNIKGERPIALLTSLPHRPSNGFARVSHILEDHRADRRHP